MHQIKYHEYSCEECKRSHTLTGDVIKKLQKYYGKALKRNCIQYGASEDEIEEALSKMRQSVLAVLYHSLMIEDEEERHKYCPSMEEKYNWCVYKNKGKRPRHQEYYLLPQYLPYLLPVFEKLSSKDLLKRCLFGFTQNANESLNLLVWKRAPKDKNNSPSATHFAAISAVVEFNNGKNCTQSFYQGLGFPVTPLFQIEKSKQIDRKRVKLAEYKQNISTAKRRQKIAEKKACVEAMLDSVEGASYESGSFND